MVNYSYYNSLPVVARLDGDEPEVSGNEILPRLKLLSPSLTAAVTISAVESREPGGGPALGGS